MKIQLPKRPVDGHKGTFGRVLIIAGSSGMSGAACLAGTAALRSGAGLVTLAVPESVQSIVAAFEPCYTTVGLSCEDDGRLSTSVARTVDQLLETRDAVAIGPGLGQEPASRLLVQAVIRQTKVPLVVDADALNAAAADRLSLTRDSPTIVTPHPGEFARLTGLSTQDITSGRQSVAEEYARETGAVVVLKGAGTIVTNGNQTIVNTTGNPGMATGGSGDVLTGVITALCGQRMSVYDSAVTGVFAHGLAGDLCASATSGQGLIASDLLAFLPRVWAKLETDAL